MFLIHINFVGVREQSVEGCLLGQWLSGWIKKGMIWKQGTSQLFKTGDIFLMKEGFAVI